ncbi:hypothetical protein CR513_51249, partial [Mucuna pruriens]
MEMMVMKVIFLMKVLLIQMSKAHSDKESHFPRLDVPGSWHIEDELYVGLRFDSKCDVQMTIKQYSIKIHRSFCMVESKLTILLMRQIKWAIIKWDGQHRCMNVMLPQDHNKLDFELICSFILVSYRKTWKAKQKAIAWVFGDWDDSYNLLPK